MNKKHIIRFLAVAVGIFAVNTIIYTVLQDKKISSLHESTLNFNQMNQKEILFDRPAYLDQFDRDIIELTGSFLEDRMSLAYRYISESVDQNGQFRYAANPNLNYPAGKKYNILRHAGTMYAMDTYESGILKNESHSKSLRNAGKFLKNNTIQGLEFESSLKAVWSVPKITNNKNPYQAKLGGTGLGLVALAGLAVRDSEFIGLDTLQALGSFLLWMQQPNGGFVSRYRPGHGGRDLSWHSLYYPGEAALGLLMLHDIDPDPKWRNSALNALLFLSRSRYNDSVVPADHWALIATRKLLDTSPELEPTISDTLRHHAKQIAGQITSEFRECNDLFPNSGCLVWDGRLAPAATRLEGLLAAAGFLDDTSLFDSAVDEGLRFLTAGQSVRGPLAGAFPRLHPDWFKSKDKQKPRDTEFRIDYVQHSLSAMIEYYRLNIDR